LTGTNGWALNGIIEKPFLIKKNQNYTEGDPGGTPHNEDLPERVLLIGILTDDG
jgi:hypothetical protein